MQGVPWKSVDELAEASLREWRESGTGIDHLYDIAKRRLCEELGRCDFELPESEFPEVKAPPVNPPSVLEVFCRGIAAARSPQDPNASPEDPQSGSETSKQRHLYCLGIHLASLCQPLTKLLQVVFAGAQPCLRVEPLERALTAISADPDLRAIYEDMQWLQSESTLLKKKVKLWAPPPLTSQQYWTTLVRIAQVAKRAQQLKSWSAAYLRLACDSQSLEIPPCETIRHQKEISHQIESLAADFEQLTECTQARVAQFQASLDSLEEASVLDPCDEKETTPAEERTTTAFVLALVNRSVDKPARSGRNGPSPDRCVPDLGDLGSDVGSSVTKAYEQLGRLVGSLLFEFSYHLYLYHLYDFKSRRDHVLRDGQSKVASVSPGKGLQALITGLGEISVPGLLAFVNSAYLDALFPADSILSLAFVRKNQAQRVPKIPKGTIDITPRKMLIRSHVMDRIRTIFKAYGAAEIDTPVFELTETLMGKYGEDQKLIFELKDQGGEQLSLRYDLTVPFARYLATHKVTKMKRFHIGKVYRRDEPQFAKGRFREFYQCDLDIAGDYDFLMTDVEILSVVSDLFDSFHQYVGDYTVKVNHRVLLDALMGLSGVPSAKIRAICSSIDKLDKMTWEEVEHEMIHVKHLAPSVTRKMHELLSISGSTTEKLTQLEAQLEAAKDRTSMDCLKYLRDLFGLLEGLQLDRHIRLDLSLARGLDYYTGIIFEVVSPRSAGSLGAGGRYNGLAQMMGSGSIPAVGMSIGVERLLLMVETALEAHTTSPNSSRFNQEVDVFVCSVGNVTVKDRFNVLRLLRKQFISADTLYTCKPKLTKQMQRANELGASVIVIVGEDEIANQLVQIKELKYDHVGDASAKAPDRNDPAEQAIVPLSAMASTVRSLLQKGGGLANQKMNSLIFDEASHAHQTPK